MALGEDRDRPLRVLVTFAGGQGHLDPMLPLARALHAAGHHVGIAGGDTAERAARREGFEHVAMAASEGSQGGSIKPLAPLDMEHEHRVVGEHYAGRLARARADLVLPVCRAWHPDVLVCDEMDFGALVAAERYGVPRVVVEVIATGALTRAADVAAPLAELRRAHGLAPDPGLAMRAGDLLISPFPPTFRSRGPSEPPAFAIGPGPIAAPRTDGREHPAVGGGVRPVVSLTLGTVFNRESGDLFERALAGLAALAVDVVATVGRDLDPARFGPQPPHVRVERFVPQAELLPRCAVSVNHGGSGSVVGALTFAIPMVVLPMGADQALNAARIDQLGLGAVLDPLRATPTDIGDAVRRVLETPSHRRRVGELGEEIARLPGPADAVPLIEEISRPQR